MNYRLQTKRLHSNFNGNRQRRLLDRNDDGHWIICVFEIGHATATVGFPSSGAKLAPRLTL